MKACEFITEAQAGRLRIGQLLIDIDDHVIEQTYFREIDPQDVDHALRKLPGIEDQLAAVDPGQKLWVRDPDTGISLGIRATGRNVLKFKTVVQGRTYQSDTPEIVLPEGREQLSELYFLGSQCTKDCSGHRAGYNWFKIKQRDPNSHSPSFNKGAALAKAGK